MTTTKVMKATDAMKAIKVVKAMKVVGMKIEKVSKPIKAMKVSKIAVGKLAYVRVFRGGKEKTRSGLKKADLTKSKTGKIVSKKRSANGKKRYASTVGKWIKAVIKAREVLGIKGFLAVKKGSPVYKKAREFYKP